MPAGSVGMLRYGDDNMEQTGPGGAARHIAAGANFRDVIEKKAWFAGSPEETIACLKGVEDKYPGLEHVMLGFPMGATLNQFKEQMTRFAKEVMPAFGPQKVKA